MKKALPLVLCGILIAASATLPAFAQQDISKAEVAALTEQIANVNRSLGEIARVLGALLDNQKVNLLLNRIQLEEQRLAPLSEELRRANEQVRAIKEEFSRMESLLEEQEKLIQRALQAGRDTGGDSRMKERIEAEIKLQREQLETAERRVRELEDDLARGHDKIAILDEQLQQLLEE